MAFDIYVNLSGWFIKSVSKSVSESVSENVSESVSKDGWDGGLYPVVWTNRVTQLISLPKSYRS
jgi:hypothetical protein